MLRNFTGVPCWWRITGPVKILFFRSRKVGGGSGTLPWEVVRLLQGILSGPCLYSDFVSRRRAELQAGANKPERNPWGVQFLFQAVDHNKFPGQPRRPGGGSKDPDYGFHPG
jgi:hypothetical protein